MRFNKKRQGSIYVFFAILQPPLRYADIRVSLDSKRHAFLSAEGLKPPFSQGNEATVVCAAVHRELHPTGFSGVPCFSSHGAGGGIRTLFSVATYSPRYHKCLPSKFRARQAYPTTHLLIPQFCVCVCARSQAFCLI